MALVEGVNSYGNRADADAYFADSINSIAWLVFSTAQRDQGLVSATRVLERQEWAGEKEVVLQDLDFPRTGLTDCSRGDVTADESLEIIQEAQYEYALALLSNPKLLTTRDATGTNIKKVEAGTAKVTYFRSQVGTRFPLSVTELVSCFFLVADSSGSISGSFASGTCDSSSFINPNATFGLNKGFS